MTDADPADQRPALIAYDGSEHAKEAVREAAPIVRGRPVVVLTAWASFREAAPSALLHLPADTVGAAIEDLDAGQLEHAEGLAAEGAELARQAGLDATPRTVEYAGPHFGAIVRLADEIDAALIVLGSRGRSALRAAMLGSVSTGVLHHTRRPVLVVRGPEPLDHLEH